MSSIGKRLRRARESKGLNQVEVFKKIGINNKTLSRYENDGTEPDADSLRRLSELYEVSAGYLIGTNEVKEWDIFLDEDNIGEPNTPERKEYIDILMKYIEPLSDEEKKEIMKTLLADL